MEHHRLEEQKRELVQFLKDEEISAIGSVEERVSVTMNSRFEVTRVSLAEGLLPHHEGEVLEKNIAQAVNAAFAKLAASLAERLTSNKK